MAERGRFQRRTEARESAGYKDIIKARAGMDCFFFFQSALQQFAGMELEQEMFEWRLCVFSWRRSLQYGFFSWQLGASVMSYTDSVCVIKCQHIFRIFLLQDLHTQLPLEFIQVVLISYYLSETVLGTFYFLSWSVIRFANWTALQGLF